MANADIFARILPDILRAIPFGRLFTCGRYRHFFDHGVDMFCIANLEGEFVDVNRAFCAALGMDREELVGLRFMKLVHPDDVHKTIEAMEALRQGADVIGFTNRYRVGSPTSAVFVGLEWKARANGKIFATARVVG